MKVHETRSTSHAHSSAKEEGKMGARRQNAESKEHDESSKKKPRVTVIAREFDNFCKATREHLSIEEMRLILEANAQDPSGSDDAVVPRWERNIPVVSEAWLIDSIEKQEARPLDAYDVVSDLAPEAGGIPLDKQDPSVESLESLTAEIFSLRQTSSLQGLHAG